jgi:EAL domain-containing protein (putative c-di-GMP-specific phosphodiesterase class I)
LHYQPWIDLSDYGVGGCEALVRWEHPRLGLVEPDDFITLAEETDLIHEVGRWVFAQAARTAAASAKSGSPLVIAINLSARQFTNPDLIGELKDAINASGADPHTLEVEITESFTMRDPMRAAAVLTTLREMGLRIALDDFGIGHSSLGYLKHLPVDIIKIDRSFVNGIPREAADAAIARAVIALAQSIRCEARAEGVESHDQALWLAAAGCRTAQGFWISRPLPQADLQDWLRERKARL